MAVFKHHQLALALTALCISYGAHAATVSTPSTATPPSTPTISPIIPDNDTMEWKDASDVPPGATFSVLSGNPEKKEPFVVRVKFPANYSISVHSHPINEYDTVLSGTLYLGTGDKMDMDKGTAMPEGSFVMIPANANHYIYTKEETEIQISGIGPWGMHYLPSSSSPDSQAKNPA